jgi:ABC-type branched-subunit amino acid transport system ATPase component
MSTQHSLKVTNISKSYSGRDVVSGVSFFVQSGEIVGLLGPNGAGKTTCFYIACGLVKTDSGQVILNNHKIDHLPTTLPETSTTSTRPETRVTTTNNTQRPNATSSQEKTRMTFGASRSPVTEPPSWMMIFSFALILPTTRPMIQKLGRILKLY